MIRYFLFFCFLCTNCFAQINTSLSTELDNFIQKEANHINREKILAIKKAIYDIEIFKDKKQKNTNVDSLYNGAIKCIEKEDLLGLLAWVYADYGFYYYNLGFYNKSLPYFLNSYHLIDELTEDEIFKPISVYQMNGYFLGEIGHYSRSISLLKKAVKKSDSTSKNYGTLLNVIGRYFYRGGNIDNAKAYFNRTLEYSNQNIDYERTSKVLGDFALLAEDNQNYNKAEKLWLESIALSEKVDNKKNTMFSQLHLGKLYVKTRQLEKGKDLILKAEDYIRSKNHLQYFLCQVKEEQLKIAQLTNNSRQELYTRRDLDSLKKVLEKKESSTLYKTINWEIEQQNFQQKLEYQQLKLQKEQFIKWTSIIISILITFLFFTAYIASRRKLKLKIAKNEEFISRIKLQKLISEQNLEETKHDLLSYKTYLQEKNEQIKQLEEEINKIQTKTSSDDINHKNELQNLLNSHLVTDENWSKFKHVFIKEHKSFYNAFIENNSNITETNLRIIFLHKLQLSNLEISNLLGISVSGVKKAKQRLRKKVENFDAF